MNAISRRFICRAYVLVAAALVCLVSCGRASNVHQEETSQEETSLEGSLMEDQVARIEAVLKPQETRKWCWAASAQMIMEALDPIEAISGKYVQCEQAKRAFPGENCPCNQCTLHQSLAPRCVNGGFPDFKAFGFRFECTTNRALSWEDLKRELDTAPVAFSWHWRTGGGHMMVAVEAREVNGIRQVRVLDPLNRERNCACQGSDFWLDYSEFVNGDTPDSAGHWHDFYAVQKSDDAEDRDCRSIVGAPAKFVQDSGRRDANTPKGAVGKFLQSMGNGIDPGVGFGPLGNDSLGQAFSVGDFIERFVVSLTDLRAFDEGDNPSNLIEASGSRIYPLLINGDVIAGVSVYRGGSKWRASASTSGQQYDNIFRIRQQWMIDPNLSQSNIFLLAIPSLNISFMGIRTGSGLKLAPTCDYGDLGWPAGVPRPAGEVFLQLRTDALSHNGFPM